MNSQQNEWELYTYMEEINQIFKKITFNFRDPKDLIICEINDEYKFLIDKINKFFLEKPDNLQDKLRQALAKQQLYSSRIKLIKLMENYGKIPAKELIYNNKKIFLLHEASIKKINILLDQLKKKTRYGCIKNSTIINE